jgi:hypothetical protein
MAYSFPIPTLKTTGLANQFTKTLKYTIDFSGKAPDMFFDKWNYLEQDQIENLYYGEVYRLKEPLPNQYFLKVKKREGTAFHFIDCTLELGSFTAKVKTPNSAAIIYILFPGILGVILAIISNWSVFNLFFGALFSFFTGCLIGSFFLNASANTAARDFDRSIKKELKRKAAN